MLTIGTGHLTGLASSMGVFAAVLITNWQTFLFYVAASAI